MMPRSVLTIPDITAVVKTGIHQDVPVKEVVFATPSSRKKMHQSSIAEIWKKTFDRGGANVTSNTNRHFEMRGDIKNKSRSKHGRRGEAPINDIRKLIDSLKKTREDDIKNEKTTQPPPLSQPLPTPPDIPTIPNP